MVGNVRWGVSHSDHRLEVEAEHHSHGKVHLELVGDTFL